MRGEGSNEACPVYMDIMRDNPRVPPAPSGPERFTQRLVLFTLCMAALMVLWQFLPAIGAWLAPQPQITRTVTPRGDLAADERANIEIFEKARDSVVFISTSQLVRDVWSRDVFSIPRGTGSLASALVV